MKPFIFSLIAVTMLGPVPAGAGTGIGVGGWYEVEGARMALVTAGEPDDDGLLRGALLVDLEPGWKTYWADPGDTGVPPAISIAPSYGLAEPGIAFPPPERVGNAYSSWAGYDEPVAFAVTFDLGEHRETFRADVFLGVCETICIPVQAGFEIDPQPSMTDARRARLVTETFGSLPEEADAAFHARQAGADEDTLFVEAIIPDGAREAELFLDDSDSPHDLGTAERTRTDAAARGVRFEIPFEAGGDSGAQQVPYVLVTDRGAVSGMLEVRP